MFCDCPARRSGTVAIRRSLPVGLQPDLKHLRLSGGEDDLTSLASRREFNRVGIAPRVPVSAKSRPRTCGSPIRAATSTYTGGWRPRRASSRRIAMMSGRFIASAVTVAAPIRVSGTTISSCQRKCSVQTCVRGLKSGTSKPESGSTAACLAHLRREHETHAKARLSSLVGPPAARGTMWSTWKVASWPSCDS